MRFICTLFVFLFLLGLNFNLVAQPIFTIAGGGNGAGDNGPATEAELFKPLIITIDNNNNLFFAEFETHTIRKISLITGIITTVAGNGTEGFSGDGELATQAALNDPQGVSVDDLGNIFIADASNNRIRKVDASTGIISTIAGAGEDVNSGDGGLAINANLSVPTGVCVDPIGNVYIALSSGDLIRKIDIGTGIISTIAGIGTAGFSGDNGPAIEAELSNPYGLFIDTENNLFFTDRVNCSIRKIDLSSGIITTVAGMGSCGYTGDDGPATEARFNFPGGLFVDVNGDIYVADRSNHAIRKVTASTGIISTITGNGTPGFSGDMGPAIDAIIDTPQGVVLDPAGNIYFVDSDNNRIRQIGDIALSVFDDRQKITDSVIYPNPSTGIFELKNESFANQFTLTVYNQLGTELFSLQNENKIDLSNFPNGNYTLLILSDERYAIHKLIMQK